MNHLVVTAIVLAACIKARVAADDVASEVKSILNETIVSMGADASQVTATSDGFMQIFTALSTAASLSIFFFKYLFGFMFQLMLYVLSPAVWMVSTCWSQFVTKPLNLFLHVLHILYPVIMFCIAAVCCGIFIGGCAGFAAEACSSILITATWGPQSAKEIEENELKLLKENESTDDGESESELLQPINVETYEHDRPKNVRASSASLSSQLLGLANAASIKTRKGKEPLVPRVESWRESVPSNSPVLIRRMKLSPSGSQLPQQRRRQNSWEWDEETEEEEEEEEVEFQ